MTDARRRRVALGGAGFEGQLGQQDQFYLNGRAPRSACGKPEVTALALTMQFGFLLGVPEPLWVLALATFDPLMVGAYLVFVVFGVARGASWRKWVIYAACAFVVAVRFLPLMVPAAGAYPDDSARPSALIPGVEMKLAIDYGSAESSLIFGKNWGDGWVVRDALIVGDGQPRSAAESAKIELPDHREPATAELLERAGVPLLDEQWLRVPYLAIQNQREAAAGGAQQVRRFVGLDRDRRPVLLQVQLIQKDSGEADVHVGIAGARSSFHDAAYLGDGVSSGGQDDCFEVRKVDGHIEVRWLLKGE